MKKLILILSLAVFSFASCSDDKRACYKIIVIQGDRYYYTNSYTISSGCVVTDQGVIVCGSYTILNNSIYDKK